MPQKQLITEDEMNSVRIVTVGGRTYMGMPDRDAENEAVLVIDNAMDINGVFEKSDIKRYLKAWNVGDLAPVRIDGHKTTVETPIDEETMMYFEGERNRMARAWDCWKGAVVNKIYSGGFE